jgi:hypothetical protein
VTAGSARASARSKYTKNNQHWVSSSVRPFAMSSFAVAAPSHSSFFLFACARKKCVCLVHTLCGLTRAAPCFGPWDRLPCVAGGKSRKQAVGVNTVPGACRYRHFRAMLISSCSDQQRAAGLTTGIRGIRGCSAHRGRSALERGVRGTCAGGSGCGTRGAGKGGLGQ